MPMAPANFEREKICYRLLKFSHFNANAERWTGGQIIDNATGNLVDKEFLSK
jgi:hypothetical protein